MICATNRLGISPLLLTLWIAIFRICTVQSSWHRSSTSTTLSSLSSTYRRRPLGARIVTMKAEVEHDKVVEDGNNDDFNENGQIESYSHPPTSNRVLMKLGSNTLFPNCIEDDKDSRYSISKNDLNQMQEEETSVQVSLLLPKISLSSSPFSSSSFSSSSSSSPLVPPKIKKTGTTIVGLLIPHQNVVILAADTRATEGTMVADKSCPKIHNITHAIFACGAGTSADLEALLRRVQYNIQLRNQIRNTMGLFVPTTTTTRTRTRTTEMITNDTTLTSTERYGHAVHEYAEYHHSISAICRAIRNELYEQSFSSPSPLGVNLILGGYDSTFQRVMLVAIHPHGSIDLDIPFTALGSGGLAAMGVLESQYYQRNVSTIEEGIQLAISAVRAGIENDLGSGSNIDICIIQSPPSITTTSWNDSRIKNVPNVTYRREFVQEEKLTVSSQEVEIVDKIHERWIQEKGDDIVTILEGRGNDNETEEVEVGDKNKTITWERKQRIEGINGFGNMPFVIASKKMTMRSEKRIHQYRRLWLDELF